MTQEEDLERIAIDSITIHVASVTDAVNAGLSLKLLGAVTETCENRDLKLDQTAIGEVNAQMENQARRMGANAVYGARYEVAASIDERNSLSYVTIGFGEAVIVK